MNIKELCDKNRLEEMKAVFKIIDTCSPSELAAIVEEIRCCHDNLIAFNPYTRLLCNVKSISLNNGEFIQLNLDDYDDEGK